MLRYLWRCGRALFNHSSVLVKMILWLFENTTLRCFAHAGYDSEHNTECVSRTIDFQFWETDDDSLQSFVYTNTTGNRRNINKIKDWRWKTGQIFRAPFYILYFRRSSLFSDIWKGCTKKFPNLWGWRSIQD